jgi:stage V sporulation protein K
MAERSRHSQLLADLAVQEAKRRSHTVVEPCHLVLVLRQRDHDKADAAFTPELLSTNDARLAALATGLSAPTLGAAADEMLTAVTDAGTEWTALVPLLVAWLQSAPPAEQPPTTTTTTTATSTTSSATTASPVTPATTGPAAHPIDDLLGSARQLAESIGALPARAGAVPWSADEGTAMVLDDLLAVAASIVTADGQSSDAERTSVADRLAALGFTGSLTDVGDPLAALKASPLLEALDAARARSYAVGLAGTARWIAAVDGQPTAKEVDRVDKLVVTLRETLAGKSEPDARAAAMDALDRLVALQGVKAELRRRLEWYEIARLRRQRGLPVSDQSMHMAFVGNPGTGKTMVARLFGQALAERGFLRSGHVVEADRASMVSKYLGGTAHAVHEVVDKAAGGVLFLDEAYTFANTVDAGGGDQYDREAVDTLIKLMEDRRDDLVVILAGYRAPMMKFLHMNEGLSSRVPVILEFPDYDLDELLGVLGSLTQESGHRLTAEAEARFRRALDDARQQPDFANGRTVRNLYEEALRHQAGRLAPLGELVTDGELATIEADDVPAPLEPAAPPPVPPGYL